MPQDLLRLLCLALALVFTGGAGVSAAPAVDTQLWSANGPVNVATTNDDVSHLFVNGRFSYSDPGTGAMAIDAQSGVFDTDFPHIDGPVNAVVSDTAGGWYLGGHFSTVGGVSRQNLVHVAWDSATGWSVDGWNPHPDGIVYALALSSDAATLYIGGDFPTINNGATVRQSLAAVTTTLSATATAWTPGLDGAVRSLLLSADDGTLYVGGEFTHVNDGSVTRNHAAAFDVAEFNAASNPNPDYGSVLTWNPNANGSVYALTLAGSRLYLGGAFTELNGGAVQRAYVAAVDPLSAAVDAGWNPGPDQVVRALAVAGGRVYLGGDFSTLNAGSASQPYLAAVDNGAGLIDGGWRPGLDAAVSSLLASPTGELYVGGDFIHVDGQQRNRLAVVDQVTATLGDWQPSSWTTVHALGGSGSLVLATGGFDRQGRSLLYIGGDFDYVGPATGSGVVLDANGDVDTNLPAVDGHVYAVVGDGNGWYIGGQFSTVGGVARTNLAYIDGSGDVSPWAPMTDGPVYELILSGLGSLYVGGAFTTVNSNTRPYLAEVATADGGLSGWDPRATGVVRALALSGTTLYAGGDFFSSDGVTASIGGQPRDYVAALNTANGDALSAWDAVVDGPVFALTLSAAGTVPSTVYLGGAFTHVNGGVNRPYLAELLTADGIETGWDAQATGAVRALALSGTTLYAGGDFFSSDGITASIGGQPRDYLAALDTGSGNALTAWQVDTDAPVHTLLFTAGSPAQLYVGGEFRLIAGISRNRLALVTAADGQLTDWNPSVGAGVDAIAEQGGNVFVGGGFASVGGVTRRHVAALDLTTGQASDWNPGVDGPVHALLVSGSRVYVGGQFTAAGGQYRGNVAALDTTTGLATGWDPDTDATVYALLPAANNVTVYVAGAFSHVGVLERNGLAEVDVNGAPTGWAPVLDSGAVVHALALSAATLYVGGDFTISDAAGVAILSRNLAAFNIAGAALLPWRPAIDGGVRDLLLSADASRLYLGGDFTVVDGQSRLHVAALDTQAESEYVTAWSADSGSASDSIRALAMSPDRTTLYLGGDFTAIAGGSRNNIAALRVVDATLLGSWIVTPDDGVDALSVARDAIYVGGRYRTIAGLPRAHLAAFATPPAETQPPVTTVSLPGGSYTSATLDAIALHCDDGFGSGCATTYYAVNDGPWIIYSGPLTFNEDTTLRYFSVDNVGNSEDITVNQQSYVIEIEPPETTISPTTEVYNSETLTLSMSCSDDKSGCAATYYTLDDSTPTTASRRYTGPFTIRGRTVVKYFSVDQVGNREDIQRASYVSSFGGSGGLTLLALLPWAALLLIRALMARRREAVDV